MLSMVRSILQNNYARFLLFVFLGLVSLAAFFIYSTFQNHVDQYKGAQTEKLKAVSKSLGETINGDELAFELDKYPTRNGVFHNLQSPIYYKYNRKLKRIKKINEIEEELYTLVYDSATKDFYYGFASSDEPFWRHIYPKDCYPKILKKIYWSGGVIGPYKSCTGTWMSAITPIRNSGGEVVSVIEVDYDFSRFYDEAWAIAIEEIWISSIIFIVIGFLLYRTIRKFLKKEKIIQNELLNSKLEIEEQNRKITESIGYAKRIQDSLLPSTENLDKHLSDSFILYMPRDIVSGDFYWIAEQDDKFIVAAADCTGHGVPGALMSMIGNTLLNTVVKYNGITRPAEILFHLRKELLQFLTSNSDSDTKDGMDIALIAYHKSSKTIEFAGAYNPVYIMRDGELMEIKGTKQPIGAHIKNQDRPFDNHEIECKDGDRIYIFSDGYADQFGGPENKKLGTRSFKELIESIQKVPLARQMSHFEAHFTEWRGTRPQLDDVLLIGLEI